MEVHLNTQEYICFNED